MKNRTKPTIAPVVAFIFMMLLLYAQLAVLRGYMPVLVAGMLTGEKIISHVATILSFTIVAVVPVAVLIAVRAFNDNTKGNGMLSIGVIGLMQALSLLVFHLNAVYRWKIEMLPILRDKYNRPELSLEEVMYADWWTEIFPKFFVGILLVSLCMLSISSLIIGTAGKISFEMPKLKNPIKGAGAKFKSKNKNNSETYKAEPIRPTVKQEQTGEKPRHIRFE